MRFIRLLIDIVGLTAAIVTIVGAVAPVNVESWRTALALPPFVGSVLAYLGATYGSWAWVAVALLVAALLYRMFDWRRRWRDITDELNMIALAFTAHASNVEQIRSGLRSGQVYDPGQVTAGLLGQIRDVLTSVAQVMRAYTGHDCHVSLKTFDRASNHVRTEARSQNNMERNETDERLERYLYTANTAFEEILTQPDSHAFVSNRLLLRSLIGRYKNENARWKRLYRATAVVPITFKLSSEQITPDHVTGFLCVDNKRGGFDHGSCINLLSMVAKNLFFALDSTVALLRQLDDVAQAQPSMLTEPDRYRGQS